MKHVLALLTLCLLLSKPAPADQPQPNIVFFFTDDQTADVLGCYGHPIAQTPHLDSLASRGMRFDAAFVNQPICWVSRNSILTGLTSRSYGTPAAPDHLSPENARVFYTDLLRQAGYRTAHFGKWHTRMPQGNRPADHFDAFESIGRDPFFKRMPDGSLRHETDLIVDRGIQFMRSQPPGQPFAMNLWFNACHAEDNDRRPGPHFAWPQSANGLYEDLEMPRPRLDDPAIFEALPDCFKTSITRERYFWRWNTPEKFQINMRAYLRMVTGIDNAVGRFLAALDEAGLADNTIIVYTADNGFHTANRGLAGKWSHFEESLRVPLIITDPRVDESRRGVATGALALNLDLPSTFLDWAGVPVPERYQGLSLRPLVEHGRTDEWRAETFHEHFAVRRRIPAWEGVRTERFKYARYFDHGHEFLHDLQSDPDELRNLAADPAHAATLASLRQRTDGFVERFGGALPPLDGGFEASTDPHPVASAAVTVRPQADGWVPLFNGRNLAGWEGDPQYWSVEDGAITGTTDGTLKSNRFLTWTGSTVRNFDLRVKVKVSPGGNSGIQYRGTMLPEIDLDIVSGYQCDIVADIPEYNGMLYEERGRRILSRTGEKAIVAPDGRPWIVGRMEVESFAPDEWHDFRVLVRGNHHQHWINGHPTADLIDLDEAGRALDGVLGMQVHVGPAMKVQFKDFRIRHLPDDLPLLQSADHPVPAGSPGVKPQGRLPQDWQPPLYDGD